MKWVILFVVVMWCCIGLYMSYGNPVRADCKDGTVSYSKHRSGTCSRHGGVAKWR
jgi:hypothetical protein